MPWHSRRLPPGRLAKDRDPLGITAKRGYIRLHPAQRRLLVQQGIIAGDMVGTFPVQLRVCKETERTKPRVNCHDHGPLAREIAAVEGQHRSRPHEIPAAMEKDHDGARISAVRRHRPYVQIEAVLALRLCGLEELSLIEGAWQWAWLRTDGREAISLPRPLPRRDRLGWTPP